MLELCLDMLGLVFSVRVVVFMWRLVHGRDGCNGVRMGWSGGDTTFSRTYTFDLLWPFRLYELVRAVATAWFGAACGFCVFSGLV